jgi:hypothetical protein
VPEYDDFCNLPNNSPWFPTGEGISVENLPPAPAPSTGTLVPPNSAELPEEFDQENPDLCSLFDDIIPGTSDPEYPEYYENPPVYSPYSDYIYLNCRLSARATIISVLQNISASSLDIEAKASIQCEIAKTNTAIPDNLFLLRGTYSQSSLYEGAELADFESMSNGQASETLKTVTDADFEAWIQLDLQYDSHIAYLLVGCDFENLLPGGFGSWSASFAIIQWRPDNTEGWENLNIDLGEFTAPIQSYYVNKICRYIRILHYGRNLAVTEFMAKSDKWLVYFNAKISAGALIEKNIPSNQYLHCQVKIQTEFDSIAFSFDKLLYLMDFESLRTTGDVQGAYTRSWHEAFTGYWSVPAWPPTLISTNSPLIGQRSLIIPDSELNYAMRFCYTPYFNFGNSYWYIKLYCTPATAGTADANGNFYQYILSLGNAINIGIDDEGYYFLEITNAETGEAQTIGGKFKDGNQGLLAVNNQNTAITLSCDKIEFSIWINGVKEFAEPKVIDMPNIRNFSIVAGYDCYIGAKNSSPPVVNGAFRGGKIDHISMLKNIYYTGEADPFQTPIPLPPSRPEAPQFIAPLPAFNNNYGADAMNDLLLQTSASRTLNVPGHLEGDLLVALVHYRESSDNIVPPLGWHLEFGDIGSKLLEYNKDARVHVYSKVALDDEEPTATWICESGAAGNSGLIVAVRNGIISDMENKTAPMLTELELEGLPTYYTFDYQNLYLEAASNELVLCGACRTWIFGYPEQKTSLNKIDSFTGEPRAQLNGVATGRPFPFDFLRGPGAIVSQGGEAEESVNLFGIKLKVGQPVPRYVTTRTLRPTVRISNSIEVLKTTDWNPNFLSPELWLKSSAANYGDFTIVDGKVDVWKDSSIHQRDFKAASDGFASASYRPSLSAPDQWSDRIGVFFNGSHRLETISPGNTWSFMFNDKYSIFLVVQFYRAENPIKSHSFWGSGGSRLAFQYTGTQGQRSNTIYHYLRTGSTQFGSLLNIEASYENTAAGDRPEILNIHGDLTSATGAGRSSGRVDGRAVSPYASSFNNNSPALPSESSMLIGIGTFPWGNLTPSPPKMTVWEVIVLSRLPSVEEINSLECYLAKEYKITGNLSVSHPCKNSVANVDAALSESESLKFSTSPVTFTPAPVSSPLYSDSLGKNPIARISSQPLPVQTESYGLNPTIVIARRPIPAVYSQSSVFNLIAYPPAAEPATILNMQNLSASETFATATNGDGGWVMMDFGLIAVVDRVVVGADLSETLLIGMPGWGGWADWYTAGSTIQYSQDAQNWTTIIENVNGFTQQNSSILEFAVVPAIACRYIRIGYIYTSNYYFAVTEFYAKGFLITEDPSPVIYSESFAPSALAYVERKLPATYSQSSLYWENLAATQAVMQNGITDEPRQTGTDYNVGANWIMMDFGAVKNFSEIVVGCDFNYTLVGGWGKFYTENASLQTSNDSVNWATVASTGTFSTPSKTFSVPGASARYVRIAYVTRQYLCATEFYVNA